MEREGEFDLVWQQWSPDEWRAVLTDRGTGARCEACSMEELAAAFEKLRGRAGRRDARRR